MPGSATAEIIFIAAMMLLILIVSAATVYFFFKTYRKEKIERLARSAAKANESKSESHRVAEATQNPESEIANFN